MKCLDDCHNYQLKSMMITKTPQILSFYEIREDGARINGTTNEDIIKVLIHRLRFLNEKWQDGKFRCKENALAIMKLREALMWLERRMMDRKIRQVEGTMEP